MYTGVHVKHLLFLSAFNKTWFSRQIFKQASNNKFHENQPSESRFVPRGRTDMTELIVAFGDVSRDPKRSQNPFWFSCYQGLWERKYKKQELLLFTTRGFFFIERHNVETANMWTPFVTAPINTSIALIPGIAYNFIKASCKSYNDPAITSLHGTISKQFQRCTSELYISSVQKLVTSTWCSGL
jgi:hypothetical protein